MIVGARQAQTPGRSLHRLGLERRAGGQPLDEFLVAQANARGIFGAYGVGPIPPVDDAIALEDIVVGLSSPEALLDGRLFKLILRIFQSGRVDAERLARLARRERADHLLYWLLEQIPEEERSTPVMAIGARIQRPRGYRPLDYRYDNARLLRRPADPGGAGWLRRTRHG